MPVPVSKPQRFQPVKSFPVLKEGFNISVGLRHGVDLKAELFDVGKYSRLEHRLQYSPLVAFDVHFQVVDDFLHIPTVTHHCHCCIEQVGLLY